ncbi:MAG TPA: hypothetical protein VMT36_01535 [Candidatus Saccharimonadia bacterium]|nr:hypothetical protein [Candidatus Saccharimonadia bacterium]
MGLFKQMKDMKNMVAEAPAAIDQANQLAANAQVMAAQQQAAATDAAARQQAAVTAAAVGPDFEPISGVSIELYAEISRDLATVNYDQAQAPALANAKGVVSADWDAAVAGWNARMQTNPAVGQRFNALYTGR